MRRTAGSILLGILCLVVGVRMLYFSILGVRGQDMRLRAPLPPAWEATGPLLAILYVILSLVPIFGGVVLLAYGLRTAH